MATPTLVYVQWADAHTSEGGWLDLEDYEDEGECLVETVGYMIPVGEPGSKKDHVSVWQTLCDGEGIHGFHIPIGMVRTIKTISF